MAARDEFPHLTFLPVRAGPGRMPRGGKKSEQEEKNCQARSEHTRRLKSDMERLKARWLAETTNRVEVGLPDLPVARAFIVKVEDSSLAEFLESAFGLEIIAEEDDGFALVATADLELKKLEAVLEKFGADAHGGGSAAKLYGIVDVESTEERRRRILAAELFDSWTTIRDEDSLTLDVSISCIGADDQPADDEQYKKAMLAHDELQRAREAEVERFVRECGGTITEIRQDQPEVFRLPDSFTLRVNISGKGFKDLALNYPYVFEIGVPEGIDCGDVDGSGGGIVGDVELVPPPADAEAVCVIDSGIQEGHKWLAPSIVTEKSKCFMPGVSDVADQFAPAGHGTRVAGAILYPAGQPAKGSTHALHCWVVNARVLNDLCQVPLDLLPAFYVDQIVRHYVGRDDGTGIRVFNHSINSYAPYRKTHMSTWAAAIDLLSYEMDVLFVQSAGNVTRALLQRAYDGGEKYPDYLGRSEFRIRNPGQSLNALTVGAIAAADFSSASHAAIAGKDRPSAFTAVGPGIWGSVKPDVVEIGGDYALDTSAVPRVVPRAETSVDLPAVTIAGATAFSRDAVGTSFAAPRVAGLAAKLGTLMPDETCLLYRALIANSARWPAWAEGHVAKEDVLRWIGYGVPCEDRALVNDEHRVTLISTGQPEVGAGEVHVYRIPVPPELRGPGQNNKIRIDVSLSYAARPRRTRRNPRGYLSSRLEWRVSKAGESYESFCGRMLVEMQGGERDGDEVFEWMLRERKHYGTIKGQSRQEGTLQKDWCCVEAHALPQDFCIAVAGLNGWDRSPAAKAKYALAVTIEAVDADLKIYQPIRAALEVPVEIEARERVRVEVDEER